MLACVVTGTYPWYPERGPARNTEAEVLSWTLLYMLSDPHSQDTFERKLLPHRLLFPSRLAVNKDRRGVASCGLCLVVSTSRHGPHT